MRRCEVCFAPLPSWAEAYLWPCVRGGLTVCADCFDTLVSGLSRRELATRQRILKDSHCGAFAVIGMVLLALCQWSVFLSGSAGESLWGLLLIPVATRACAGLAVLKLRPMGTSQYAAMGRHGGYAAALAVLLAAAIAVPLVMDRSFAPLAAAAGYGLAVWYGFRQLDGMNGDISGFALTLGELAGAAVWTLVR